MTDLEPVTVEGACVECGNDDPTEGHIVCTDCLEEWGDPCHDE